MDFFEAQARAKKRTTRLVVLFVLAVLGIIAAGYFAFIVLTAMAGVRATANGGGLERAIGGLDQLQLWQPGALIAFSLLTFTVVGLSALGKWLQLRAGGRAIAKMVGAREILPQTTHPRERQLLNIVEEMSIASGLPLPGVFILDDETGINAFAAGLTTSDAVVAVTRGTLEKLSRDELQGVVAHEFSHILNGDMRLNVRLTAVLFGILVIGLIGRGIVGSLRHSRPRRGGKEGNGVAVILVVGLVLLVLGYVGYFFGRLIQAAVSRQREFLADAKIKLTAPKSHLQDFLDCVKSREQPRLNLERGHHVSTVAHLGNIAYRTGSKITWDAEREKVVGNKDADRLVSVEYRKPWKLDYMRRR